MLFQKSDRVIVLLMLAGTSAVANAAPVEFPAGSGHFYELVSVPGITWDAARTAASLRQHNGSVGHLATINSLAEDTFLKQLNTLNGSQKLAWVGGSQNLPCAEGAEPGCGWQWITVANTINGEKIAASNTVNPYTNWVPGQPDNAGGARHLAIDNKVVGWRDAVAADVGAYIAEYGDTLASFAAGNCAAGGPGCNWTGGGTPGTENHGVVTRFDASALINPNDPSFTVSAFLLQDDPARCGKSAGTFVEGQLVVSAAMCARKAPFQFVALRSESSVQFPSGVLSIEGHPGEFGLPEWGNPPEVGGCSTPIPDGVPATDQDMLVWAYSDPRSMLEADFVAANPLLNGNLAEVTNKCSHLKASGGRGSWIVLGLSYEPGGDSQARMLELAQYKVALLLISFDRARAEGSINKPTHSNLVAQGKNIQGDITKKNYGEAIRHVENLQKTLATTTFRTELDSPRITRNWYGEAKFRIDNIFDMLSRRMEPFLE